MQQFVKLHTVKSWLWLVMTVVIFVTLGEPRIALAGTVTPNATGVSVTAIDQRLHRFQRGAPAPI
jgi:hypothetical protein